MVTVALERKSLEISIFVGCEIASAVQPMGKWIVGAG
jgi:hypothetical protein